MLCLDAGCRFCLERVAPAHPAEVKPPFSTLKVRRTIEINKTQQSVCDPDNALIVKPPGNIENSWTH